jgi:hypothetical protein
LNLNRACAKFQARGKGIIMRLFVQAALIINAAFIASPLVLGGTLTVASSGMFSNTAPTTTWSAPSTSWSFSFNVSNTPTVSNVDSFGFDATYSGFSYLLGGGNVASTPRIRFFTSIAGGLFSIYFVDSSIDGVPGTGFVFNGGQAFSNTTAAPTILTGVPTTGAFFYAGGQVVDSFAGDVVNITAPGSAPEPVSLALVAAGCCLFGWMRRRQRVR